MLTQITPPSPPSPSQSVSRVTTSAEPHANADLELSIVLPCLNEAKTLGACIRKARRFLNDSNIAGEIIVADNGSTDGSQEIAQQLGVRVAPVAERGYGAALAQGIAAARGRYIIMGDSDDSYDFTALMPFVAKLREGFDLVIGNRFAGGIEEGAMPFLHRYLGNPVLTAVGRLFFKSPCGDFYCGLRGFQKTAVQQMNLQSTGMEFALEMIVRATMLRMRITEVPTTLSPDGRSGRSHLRTWRDGWRSLRLLLLYSPRWLFLYPGLALMFCGALLGIWLAPRPRLIGDIFLDVHTMLYCAVAVVLGFQAILFWLFGKILAINAGFHPRGATVEKWLRTTHLEGGLVIGAALILTGLATSVYALIDWQRHAFSNLNPFEEMRIVIPAALALILGGQTFFASFYLSLLQLQNRRLWKPLPPRECKRVDMSNAFTARLKATCSSEAMDDTAIL
jgi:glycosyltransferase involved in cell wall biosynthesis